jgi:hypothetical protein
LELAGIGCRKQLGTELLREQEQQRDRRDEIDQRDRPPPARDSAREPA